MSKSRVHRFLALLVSALLGGLCTFALVTCQEQNGNAGQAAAQPPVALAPSAAAATAPPTASPRIEDERNTIAVFANTANSCVFVTQRQLVVDYFAGRARDVAAGSGSGWVWDREGHVVTNFHVIANAQKLTVTLQNQKTFPATVVGSEPRKDIAVLKIEAPPQDLTPIQRYAGRWPLEVGQKVIAIGNPFGLDHTLTTGIISALGREVDGIGGVTIRDMIQTDAAINPGNSGGPLLDSSGRLIGMNTMIFSRSGASAGIGFAVSAQTIGRIVPQLIKSGRVEQVGLGIEIDPQRRLERHLGLRGMIVIAAIPDSPAAKAGVRGLEQNTTGLRLGDVVIAIDGKEVKDYDDLYNLLDGRRAGEKAKVTLLRDRGRVEIELPLVVIK